MNEPDNPKWRGQEVHDEMALAIGRIALAWNEFQESLGEIFASVFKDRWRSALFAWQAIDNDFAQREMLRAVAGFTIGRKREYKELCWLLDHANQHLRNWRNTGLHTPFVMFTDHAGGKGPEMIPYTWHGHRRANSLRGKNVLREFQNYGEDIRAMNGFALALAFRIRGVRDQNGELTPWPKRPPLLSLPPNPNPKGQAHRRSAK